MSRVGRSLQDVRHVRTHPSDSSDDFNSFDGLDDWTDLGLDDEPESIFDFLHCRREAMNMRGIQSVPGVSFRVEVTIYNCLIRECTVSGSAAQ